MKTTIMGGLLFLLPAVIILIFLGYAMQLVAKVVQPISKLLPDAVVGVGGITVFAALALVLISFLAGLVARTIDSMRAGSGTNGGRTPNSHPGC